MQIEKEKKNCFKFRIKVAKKIEKLKSSRVLRGSLVRNFYHDPQLFIYTIRYGKE